MSEHERFFRLLGLGDIMLGRDVGRHFEATPSDFEMLKICESLSNFDLVCANLESPVSLGGRPNSQQDPHVTFRAHPRTLDVLKRLGVSVVSLGNNHILDYGQEALAGTIESLEGAGIGWVGAGRNYAEANRPLLVQVGPHRAAFLSYSFIYSVNTRKATRWTGGVSDHRIMKILPLVRELDRSGYVVIALMHWGHEYSFYPVPYQMRAARRIIDAGARLVLGHGPHYPQGFEKYRQGLIVYSLGNFIFDEPYRFSNRSFMVGLELAHHHLSLQPQVFPVRIQNHVPELMDGLERKQIMALVDYLTAKYPSLNARFWDNISASYLGDVCYRAIRNRSIKYLTVPDLSLYRDGTITALARKLRGESRFVTTYMKRQENPRD